MKKLVTLLLAVVMLTTMAFASSPSGGSTGGGTESSPAAEIKVSVAYVEVKASTNVTAVEAWSGNGKKEVGEYLAKTAGAQPIAAFELKGTPGAVTLEMPGLVAGTNYVVLHYKSDGKLEVLPATVNGRKLSFTVESFSPFVVVAVPTGTVKAPNTGAVDASGLAAVMVLTLAGAAVLRYKKVR